MLQIFVSIIANKHEDHFSMFMVTEIAENAFFTVYLLTHYYYANYI